MLKKGSYIEGLILNANMPKKKIKNNVLQFKPRKDKPSVEMIFANCL
jgi:hypothetical protein